MRKYKVKFVITGIVSAVVEARDEDDAEEKAAENFNQDNYELDDMQISECYDIEEVTQ